MQFASSAHDSNRVATFYAIREEDFSPVPQQTPGIRGLGSLGLLTWLYFSCVCTYHRYTRPSLRPYRSNTLPTMKSFQLLLSTASTLLHGVIGAPSPPGLSYLGTANASLAGPIMVGVGPLGPRIVFGITGGTFKGPSFSGMFPPPPSATFASSISDLGRD